MIKGDDTTAAMMNLSATKASFTDASLSRLSLSKYEEGSVIPRFRDEGRFQIKTKYLEWRALLTRFFAPKLAAQKLGLDVSRESQINSPS